MKSDAPALSGRHRRPRGAHRGDRAAAPIARALALDFVIVNGENAAGGFGINEEICQALFLAGVDCISTGNHAFDQRDQVDVFDSERRLLRPVNYPKGVPGRGVGLYEHKAASACS